MIEQTDAKKPVGVHRRERQINLTTGLNSGIFAAIATWHRLTEQPFLDIR